MISHRISIFCGGKILRKSYGGVEETSNFDLESTSGTRFRLGIAQIGTRWSLRHVGMRNPESTYVKAFCDEKYRGTLQ